MLSNTDITVSGTEHPGASATHVESSTIDDSAGVKRYQTSLEAVVMHSGTSGSTALLMIETGGVR